MVDLLFILGWVVAYAVIGFGFRCLVKEGGGDPDPIYLACWLPILVVALLWMAWEWLEEQA